MISQVQAAYPSTNIKFGNAQKLERLARDLVPRTFTIFRQRQPNLSGLTQLQVDEFARKLGIPQGLTAEEVMRQAPVRYTGRGTGTFINTEEF